MSAKVRCLEFGVPKKILLREIYEGRSPLFWYLMFSCGEHVDAHWLTPYTPLSNSREPSRGALSPSSGDRAIACVWPVGVMEPCWWN